MKSIVLFLFSFILICTSIIGQEHQLTLQDKVLSQISQSQRFVHNQESKYTFAAPEKKSALYLKQRSDNYSLDSILHGVYLTDGSLKLKFKDEFVYDANGNIISMTKYRKSTSWVFKYKLEYSYSQDENLTTLTYYGWDDDKDEWNLGYRYYYYFDNQNNLTQFIDSNYSSNQDTWEIREKIENTYDNNGKILTYLEKYYFFGELDSQEKIEYDYNTDNKLQIKTRYETDDDPTLLELHWKVEYNYDNDGNLSPEMSYGWDADENGWAPKWKLLYTYNDVGKALSEIASNWISDDDFWNNQWKYDFAYDANTNQTSRHQHKWIMGSEEWEYNYKQEYTYDLSSDYSQLVLPPFNVFEQDYVGDIENIPLSYDYYVFEDDSWTAYNFQTYHYSEVLLSTSEIAAPDIMIFPNPASDQLNISNVNGITFEEIVIYNLSGQKVIQQRGNTNLIDVSQLDNGLYTIELRLGESVIREKVIITK